MEATTSFDLNLAIQCWRKNLAQSPTFLKENLDELESHLRDSIAALQTRGLSSEEAFMVAMNRVGTGNSLVTEFGKINEQVIWHDRILWMLVGLQVWMLVSSFIGRLVYGTLGLALAKSNYDFAAHGRTLLILLFSLVLLGVYVGCLRLCWWLVVRKGKSLGDWIQPYLQRRTHLMVTCSVICVLAIAASSLSHAFQVLFSKVTIAGGNLAETNVTLGLSATIVNLVQIITFITLTLLLARKRLQPVKA
jgi:hypothetical protein